MAKSPYKTFRPCLEGLETREVPAAVTVNYTGGYLNIIGTYDADRIAVSLIGSTIRVLGTTPTGTTTRYVTASAVKIIAIIGDSGNDQIAVSPAITRTAYIYGGWGNDVLYGGSGHDRIYGGDGQDVILGRNGNDIIFGGDGADRLDGGTGANSLFQNSVVRSYAMNGIELLVLQLVNQERTSRGLAPLSGNSLLAQAAKWHSSNMASRGESLGIDAMQHTLFGTTMPTPFSRIQAAGYDNAQTWGENIAAGYTTAQSVVEAWMNSPGHRANILSPNFKELGVGLVVNSQGLYFWTQSFGAR